MPRSAILLVIAAAAACSQSNAPSAEQNRALDNAGQMLDDAPDALNQIEGNALAGNEASVPGAQR
jgi:hypothetical protein